MHQTKKRVFEEITKERPFCERAALLHDHVCAGRSTMEHAFIYGGKQIPDKWAVIRLCEYAHSVNRFATSGILNKEINHWIALQHANDTDLIKYPKVDWIQLKSFLNRKYDPNIRRRRAKRTARVH